MRNFDPAMLIARQRGFRKVGLYHSLIIYMYIYVKFVGDIYFGRSVIVILVIFNIVFQMCQN